MLTRFFIALLIPASLVAGPPGDVVEASAPQERAPQERATPPGTNDPIASESAMPNLPSPTAGGLQFWSDVRVRDDHRVQFNAVTGRYRMIDDAGVRRAWGNRDACLAELERRRPWTLADNDGRTVTILLHGLMRTRHCMEPMAAAVRERGGPAVAIGYASTRRGVADHAVTLGEVIADWPVSWRLRFVAHSMGNIVTRCWVGDRIRSGETAILDRCEAMVMLGPPNQGSSIATSLRRTGVFGMVAGSGGMQMGPAFDEVRGRLATPPFPFAIIAGDVSHYPVQNPLLDGPNDLLVTVEETRLAGAVKHVTVPCPHARLMERADVVDQSVELLGQIAPR